MTHTTGPWQFTANMYGINNMQVFGVEEINDGFTQSVANCGYGKGSEANARLIAAAPELLETLKDISVWLTAPAKDKATIDYWKQKVSTVITKATGV